MKLMKKAIKNTALRIPPIRKKVDFYTSTIVNTQNELKSARKINLSVNKQLTDVNNELADTKSLLWVEPDHFYSPITHSMRNTTYDAGTVGIKLNDSQQLDFLKDCSAYYSTFPYFEENNSEVLRYTFDNNQFGHSDAIFLYCMIRHIKPKRIIEVGSGFSSGIMLDSNALFFNNNIILTFIDPYPARIKSILKKSDNPNIIAKEVQKVDLTVFSKLESGDILFIDSSHISKTGSDVNFLYFEVLPRLKPGVIVHIHDIFYPFEYPKKWIKEGRSWNELYLLRALLISNNEFEIVLWPNYLHQKTPKIMEKNAPLSRKNWGGSIWLRKC